MSELGTFSLRLALFLAAYAVVIDVLGSRRREQGLMQSASNAGWACWLCLSTAIVALLIALAQGDFSIKYVAAHTSRALPLAYRLSALWAGAAGSLLLWLWMQVGMAVLVFRKGEPEQRHFAAYARAAANVVCCFFLVVLLFDKNVFAVSLTPPADGGGLNPLLQHPAMVLHPPTLFLGYAAYIIPFAWTLAALSATPNHVRPASFLKARTWMLIAWLFLTIGNALGSWWAYEELGWGGFWAWDPVENSSLMPWLAGTALLHCFKRFRPGCTTGRWVFFLSLFTYSLCIFGTFLTRYGLVSSVHAFPEPGLGILFLVLLAVIWVLVAILTIRQFLLRRTEHAEPTKTIKGYGITVFVNWLFIALIAVIFLGTLFPFFSGLLSSEKITLQPEHFTKITAPGGLLLLLLIGVCPHLFRHGLNRSWRVYAGIIAAVAAILLWLFTHALAIPCFIICGFVALNIVADLVTRGARPPAQRSPHKPLSWYAARLAHIGVVMTFVGIAGSESKHSIEQQVALNPSESTVVRGHTITFDKIVREKGPNFSLTAAEITVEKNGKIIKMKPALSAYDSGRQTSEIDVKRSLAGDLYIALTAVQSHGQLINLRVLIKPLINWLWLGSIAMVIGSALVLVSWRRPKKEKEIE